jgi:hypothetical protein
MKTKIELMSMTKNEIIKYAEDNGFDAPSTLNKEPLADHIVDQYETPKKNQREKLLDRRFLGNPMRVDRRGR